ncbi:MAG: hypothetical protein QM621_03095 [Aeromicrobium sp.]|uniref:hypothetical protein n=1 Tax=Aeromicrobium sp. TaxID=1871063 RepID=UPI0039E238B1
MTASAAILKTTGMVEVIVRNAMDRALQDLERKRSWSSWLIDAPLDRRGLDDLRTARDRATRFGRHSASHGKVVAELTLGFWRYLAASRYLTSLWTPALHRAFPGGPSDKLTRQRHVDRHLKNLLLVRNRAAHGEPIHRRDLLKDQASAISLATWVDATAGRWVADLSPVQHVMARKPVPPSAR